MIKSILIVFVITLSTNTISQHKKSKLPSKADVIEILTRVNNNWQKKHNVRQNAFWHPTTYHIGNLAAYQTTHNQDYLDYSIEWAEHNQWSGAKSNSPKEWKFSYGESDKHVLFGDWQACFQVYIDLHSIQADEYKIKRAKEVMNYQVNTSENKYWWWIDGLFMVMPVMPRMYELTQDTLYLEKLYEYYNYTLEKLYDKETGLFYRDDKYIFPKHKTATGEKDFWSRGNGWVFAALARTLDKLHKTDPHYEEYLKVYYKMATKLKATQQSDGYWTRSLLDAQHAPGPETSGTAFFTYGLLWGINSKVLNKHSFSPTAIKAWYYLEKVAVQDNGTVGYIQPIGEKAVQGQIIDANSTSDFGIGAFLLAASEMVSYLDKQ